MLRAPMCTLLVLVLPTIAKAQSQGDSLKRAYTQSCYTGVVQAQRVLPDIPKKDELLKRGYLSCDGSLIRMGKTGLLDHEPSMAELGCGYAVGAMFAKYGYPDEVKPLSERAIKAATACVKLMQVQSIK